MNNNEEVPKGLRVLLVDEDPQSLEFLGNTLQECQYHVTKSNGSEEALLKLRENKDGFNIVMAAVDMPSTNAFQLLGQIKQMGLPLSVVLFSNKDESEDQVNNAMEQGASHFIIKPDRSSMVKLIWEHIFNNKTLSENSHIQKQPIPETQDQERPTPGEAEKQEEEKEKQRTKKQRFVWTPRLRDIFVEAVNYIGYTRAAPKKILEYMQTMHGSEVPDFVNRQHISSHLQKYRQSCEKPKECTPTLCPALVYSQPSFNTIMRPGASHPPLVAYRTNNAAQIGRQQPVQLLKPEPNAVFQPNYLSHNQAQNIPPVVLGSDQLLQPLPLLPPTSHEFGYSYAQANGGVTNNPVVSLSQGTVRMHNPNHVSCLNTRLMPQQYPQMSVSGSACNGINNPLSTYGLPLRQNTPSFNSIPVPALGSHNVTNAGGYMPHLTKKHEPCDSANQNGSALRKESFGCLSYECVISQDTGLQPFCASSPNVPSSKGNNISNFNNRISIGDAEAGQFNDSFLFDDPFMQQILQDSPHKKIS